MFKLSTFFSTSRFHSSVKSEKGLSIVEIILVIMIIGFIVSIINTLPPSIGLIGISKHESIAKEIAQKQIEDLRTLSYDNICDPSGGACTTLITDPRLASLPGSSSQVVIDVCPVSICTQNEQVKKTVVTVNWIETGNKTKKVEISTFISKGGLQ